MKITVTIRDLFDKAVWCDYCRLTGTNEWAVNEGQMSSDEEVTLTLEQAKELRLL